MFCDNIMRFLFILIAAIFFTVLGHAENTRTELLYNTGIRCYEKGEYASSVDFLLKCMEAAKESDEKDIYCKCLNGIGYVYIRIDDVNRGIYYLKKGYEMARQYGLKELEAVNVTSLVSAYCFSGDIKLAKYYFNIQKSLPRENKHIKYYFEMFNTGLIAQTEGNNSKAVSFYKKAIKYGSAHNIGEKLLSSVFGLLVYISLAENDVKQAKAYCSWYNDYAFREKSSTAIKTYFEIMRDINGKTNNNDSVRYYESLIDSMDNAIIDEQKMNNVGGKLLEFENKVNKENINLLNKKISYQQLTIAVFVIMMILLVSLIVVLVVKDIKLRKAFRFLIKKNDEMDTSQKKYKQLLNSYCGQTGEKDDNKTERQLKRNDIGLTQVAVDTLLNKILAVMESIDVISNSDFNLSQLAQMVDSNTKYVSWTINDTYGKNFKTLLNEYRIREACRRLKDTENYGGLTIQAIYKDLGYSSASNFITAFKKVTGMTPSVFMRLSRK